MEITYDFTTMTVTFPPEADENDFVDNPHPESMYIDFQRQVRLPSGKWRAPLVKRLQNSSSS